MAVVFHNACCSWSTNEIDEQIPVLNHVDLSLSRGSFITIVGEVTIMHEILFCLSRQILWFYEDPKFEIHCMRPSVTFTHVVRLDQENHRC